ncbi:hypothetical protein ACJOV8_008585 [Formosa sp. 3Alg 14/1]|uniref:hypothetical protein n=1 Tax=unclassified Formosa TaxID=2644710 RepID=UPI0039BEB117
MKNIYKTLCLLTLSSFVFTACDDNDDNTGESSIDYTKINATVSTSQSSYEISEIDAYLAEDGLSIPFTVTLAEPSTADAVIDLAQTGGTADADDFHVSSVTVPAGSTTATGAIFIDANDYEEGDETLVISATSRANFNLADFSVEINIVDDYVSQILDLTLSWEGTYVYTPDGFNAEVTVDFCDIDVDIAYVYFGSVYNLGGGATGDCPEHSAYEAGGYGLPDGEWTILADIYENNDANLFLDEPIPLTLDWSVANQGSGTITVDGLLLSTQAGTQIPVATVIVSEGGTNIVVTPYE